MPNFFIDKENMNREIAEITGEEAGHIVRVLRMREGDEITLFDGEGNCADAIIEKADAKCVFARIGKRYPSVSEPRLKITLFQGIPKNPKMEYVVQKAVEIGVCRVVPVKTKRTVVKLSNDGKTERWQKIAYEAAKQCGRAYIPQVSHAMDFDAALDEAKKCDSIIIPYECEKEGKLAEAFDNDTNSLAIFIGPEGGFEEEEVKKAVDAGAVRVTLGKRILRTETAGLVCAALCLYKAGDMQ